MRLTMLPMITAALAALLALPGRAEACIPIPNASGLTDMEGRRAVIWLREQTFEMMFQNRYSGDAKDFAWVIPLPGVPTAVGQPSDTFFDDLDRFTAPMFEQQECVVPCPSRNGWGADAGLSAPGGTVPPPDVTVWGSGKLGDLEYTVISATAAGDLIAWLEPRGFALPVELQPLVSDYLAKGFVFFAAKIAAGAATPAAVPVVKFTFDRKTTPVIYPLRISAFNREQPLDTLLWIIAQEGTYRPKNYPTLTMGTGATSEHTEQTYTTALEQAMGANGGITFAVQYASQPGGAAQTTNDYNRQMLMYSYGISSDAEMQELVFDYQQAPFVVRVRASLNPKGTNEDLELEQTSVTVGGWYVSPCPGGVVHEQCDTGPTPAPDAGPTADSKPPTSPTAPTSPDEPTGDDADEGGCAVAAPPPASALSLAGLLLAALILARRRRR